MACACVRLCNLEEVPLTICCAWILTQLILRPSSPRADVAKINGVYDFAVSAGWVRNSDAIGGGAER